MMTVGAPIAIGFLGHGTQIMAGNPAMMLFLTRDAGVTILMKIIQIAGRGDGPCELSHEEIGTSFGVSRTHVRKILQDGVKQGLFALSGRGHRLVEITPVMWQAFDRFEGRARPSPLAAHLENSPAERHPLQMRCPQKREVFPGIEVGPAG